MCGTKGGIFGASRFWISIGRSRLRSAPDLVLELSRCSVGWKELIRVRFTWCDVSRFDQPVNTGEEILGRARFQVKLDTKVAVFIFCFRQSTDNKHRHRWGEIAQVRDELGTAHAGHQVIRNDEVDGLGKGRFTELIECLFGTQHRDDVVAGAFEDGLTSRGLNGVVVDEQKRCWHEFLKFYCEVIATVALQFYEIGACP